MSYSCAIFRSPDETLEAAQRNKKHSIIEKAEIAEDDHVLEIGCGWGGFALEAVKKTGCRITGITVSQAQHDYAQRLVSAEGLEEKISVLLCDYRHVTGKFDKIVSIEMLEAVGHRFLGTFFEACDRLLKEGGRVVLQTITVPDQRYDSYRKGVDWIRKHIFPGGHLPSLKALTAAMTSHSKLNIVGVENIGAHYARTLREWRNRFNENIDTLTDMGFDKTFQRKWVYYLACCEGGFAADALGDLQIVLRRMN
jgi:cyclopropane-fatty-acyl-phospholipid synthase